MRRVLLITFHYPPQQTIGALRPRGLAKYLPEYGWEAIVLTPRVFGGKRPEGRLLETRNRDVLQDLKAKFGFEAGRHLHEQLGLQQATKPNSKLFHTKVIEWLKGWVAYPDSTKGWIPFALEVIAEFARREQVDAILTSSPPESCHIIGAEAKKLLQRPWIADFRDLWTQNTAQQHHSSLPLRVRLEKRTLAEVDALVTVSTPWAGRLRERYPAKSIYVIPNGFDPDDFQKRPQELTSYFSITYAGTLYEGMRDPSLLFQVLGELIREQILPSSKVRVRFYGNAEPWLPALIAQHGLEDVVELKGVSVRAEVLQREMESQVLLLLGWSDHKETGQHSGKLFEYFGAGRPILAIGGSRGVLTEALEETKAGIHALSRQQLRQSLVQMYAEFRDGGQVRYHADSTAIEQYNHRLMAKKVAAVLNDTMGDRTFVTRAYSFNDGRLAPTGR